MIRVVLIAAILVSGPALAQAQSESASAPLVVTATVVSTCRVDVPRSAEASTFETMPLSVTCAKRGAPPRVQRPIAPRLSELQGAVLIINF